jgi:hypothetical protein
MVRHVVHKMIVGDSRKHRNPISSCKKPVQPLFNMILIDLIVSPSVNITMEPKVHKVTVIKSVIKQSDKVVVVTTTPRLFIRVSNQVKITNKSQLSCILVLDRSEISSQVRFF